MSPTSSEALKLHPAAFLAHAISGFAQALVPLLVAFVTSGPSLTSGLLLTALGGAFGLIAGYYRWSSTTYFWTPTTLHLRTGVFSPDETTIPLARIAAVDDQQGIVQRLFGVVGVHVQTAGGGAQGEIVLTAVTHADAAVLRAAIGHAGAGLATAAAADLPQWRLSRSALVVAAVTGPQVGVIAPALGGALALASGVFQVGNADALERWAPSSAHGWVLAALALIGAAVVASLGGAVVGFSGFRVQVDGSRLRIRRGLVERRAASVALERVLAVRIDEGGARRPFGLCSVRLEVAGYAKEAAVAQTLIPLCRSREVAAILARLVPDLPVPDMAGAQRPPARSRRRYVVPAVLPPLVVVGLGLLVLSDVVSLPAAWWLTLPVAAVAGAGLGLSRFGDAAWWRSGDVVAVRRRRVLARTTLIARVAPLQHRELRASVLQRRAGLASVGFAVASGAQGRVLALEAAEARRLFAALG